MSADVEQIIGREGETATLLGRCPSNSNLRLAVSPHVISTVMPLLVVMLVVRK